MSLSINKSIRARKNSNFCRFCCKTCIMTRTPQLSTNALTLWLLNCSIPSEYPFIPLSYSTVNTTLPTPVILHSTVISQLILSHAHISCITLYRFHLLRSLNHSWLTNPSISPPQSPLLNLSERYTLDSESPWTSLLVFIDDIFFQKFIE